MILVEQTVRVEVLHLKKANANAVIKKLAKGLDLTRGGLEITFSTFGCVGKSFVVLSKCQGSF